MTLAVMILALAMQQKAVVPEFPPMEPYVLVENDDPMCPYKASFDGGPLKPLCWADYHGGEAGDVYDHTPSFLRASDIKPFDVPAVQARVRKYEKPYCSYYDAHTDEIPRGGAITCLDDSTEWTCANKSRVLLTSEDGKKHCILFTK